jgi:hypothetical protein
MLSTDRKKALQTGHTEDGAGDADGTLRGLVVIIDKSPLVFSPSRPTSLQSRLKRVCSRSAVSRRPWDLRDGTGP